MHQEEERETKSNTLQSDLESLMTLWSGTPHEGRTRSGRKTEHQRQRASVIRITER